MSAWIKHVKSYASKNKISYKQAMSKARPSYKATGTKKVARQTKKDRMDESKGMKGQKKGTTSKSNKNFEGTTKSTAPKRRKGMETVELDGKKVKFKRGALHKALKTPEGYKFKMSGLKKINKTEVGGSFDFLGTKRKMTAKLKKQITLGMNLMKK